MIDDEYFYNALCFCDEVALKNALHDKCIRINYASKILPKIIDERINFYQLVQDGEKLAHTNLFVPSLLLKEKTIDNVIEFTLVNDAKLIILAAYNLQEAGKIDATFNLTPIQLLHKVGILQNCMIAGGAALLNEDLDLLAQENVPLILTPTFSAGNGYGFMPIKPALNRNIKLHVGTADNEYNKNASFDKELEFLYLSTCANLNTKNAIFMQNLSFGQ